MNQSHQISDSTRTLVVSYLSVRRAVGGIGLLLPILLGPIGWLVLDIPIQDNISSYYHTALRDVFVGSMCAIGIFLFCYQGYDWIERWTANLGCAAAIGVALFPVDANSDPLHQESVLGYLHLVAGTAFFLILAFYSLYHFPTRAGAEREVEPHLAQRNFVYRTSGIVILLSLVAMAIQLFFLTDPQKQWLNQINAFFWLEWIAVWAFAAAWLTKGRAIFTDIAIDLMTIPSQLLRSKR